MTAKLIAQMSVVIIGPIFYLTLTISICCHQYASSATTTTTTTATASEIQTPSGGKQNEFLHTYLANLDTAMANNVSSRASEFVFERPEASQDELNTNESVNLTMKFADALKEIHADSQREWTCDDLRFTRPWTQINEALARAQINLNALKQYRTLYQYLQANLAQHGELCVEFDEQKFNQAYEQLGETGTQVLDEFFRFLLSFRWYLMPGPDATPSAPAIEKYFEIYLDSPARFKEALYDQWVAFTWRKLHHTQRARGEQAAVARLNYLAMPCLQLGELTRAIDTHFDDALVRKYMLRKMALTDTTFKRMAIDYLCRTIKAMSEDDLYLNKFTKLYVT